jgi:hypothetical protein
VANSPLVELLQAVDQLDTDAVMARCAADCRFFTVDGRRAHGRESVRQLLHEFLAQLRWTTHEVTAEWHQDDVWFGEVLASYELRDWLRLEALPRAFVVRAGADGIHDIRVYGANERPISDHQSTDDQVRVGGRLMLPL